MNEPVQKEFCSTSEAAQMLGLSLGTVQQMVEAGTLEGWKTAGGHRRIRVASVHAFLNRNTRGQAAPDRGTQGLKLLVAEDDEITRRLYTLQFEGWNLPLETVFAENGMDALVEIGRAPPDLLLTDLRLPGIDGFEMIRRLRADSRLNGMDVVVVSGLDAEEIEARGGLPPDVTVYPKPVPFQELKGFIQAMLARKLRAGAGS